MNNANNASGIPASVKVPCLVAMPITAHLLGSSVSCSAHAVFFGRVKLSTF